MKKNDDDFKLALSTDKNFVVWYVLATMLVFDSLMKSQDFKLKCLESYKKAMSERAQNGQ